MLNYGTGKIELVVKKNSEIEFLTAILYRLIIKLYTIFKIIGEIENT